MSFQYPIVLLVRSGVKLLEAIDEENIEIEGLDLLLHGHSVVDLSKPEALIFIILIHSLHADWFADVKIDLGVGC